MADSLVTYNLDSLEIEHHLGSGSFSSVYSFSTKKKQTSSSLKRQLLPPSTLSDLTLVTDGTTSSASRDESRSKSAFLDDGESESAAHVVVANNDRNSNNNNNNNKNNNNNNNNNNSNNSLALKKLHNRVVNCRRKFLVALRDLKNEVNVLSSLPRHPNIIELYGTSEDFGKDSSNPESTFIVLGRLNESLEAALQRWKLESKLPQSQYLFRRRRAHLSRSSQNMRLQYAAIGAARALHFLHSRRIIYRDVKPPNLGFDSQGNIRLFDFGLATPVQYGIDLNGRVGTLRYMAPEVASRIPYHLSADVYSFGMILYEILTLSKPYKNAKNKDDLEDMVTDPKCYPTLQKVASPSLRVLLHKCRSLDRVYGRPTMAQVLLTLEQECS